MRISIETAAVTMEVWRQRIKVISRMCVCAQVGGCFGVVGLRFPFLGKA